MKKVLITGGCGDIGYYLSNYHANLGNEVTLIDNFSRGMRDKLVDRLLEKDNVRLLEGNLCNLRFVNELELDFDLVFHLAATNGTENFYKRPFTVLENCTLPTIFLLQHFSNAKNLQRFIYAGSSESYASTVNIFNWPVPTKEDVPLCIADPRNVRWSYGGSKLHGELAAFAAAEQFGTLITVIRFHNVFGPRMGDKHVIPDFISRAQRGIYELNGYKDTRSFIFVTDAVEACSLVADSPNTINQVINIGGEQEISMLDLGKLILRVMGKHNEKIVCKPSPRGSVYRRAPNIDKLRSLTGFKAKVSLEDGIRKVLAV